MTTNDQTAAMVPDNYSGKHILIIGSGEDLDSRRMMDEIDKSDKWDLVVRINKMYGRPECVGTRTDIIVTRWHQWVKPGSRFFQQETVEQAQKIVILNQSIEFSETEKLLLSQEIGVKHVSAGPQAIAYFLNRGCEKIDLIGFGYLKGQFMQTKRYCDNAHNYSTRMVDKNALYDWEKERAWMTMQPQVCFIE